MAHVPDAQGPRTKIHGPISPDQAKALREREYDSLATQALLGELGAVADEHSVALVLVDPKAIWPPARGRVEGTDHYVTLDPRDIGTILLPGREDVLGLGLPPADKALDSLMSPESIIQQ